MVFSACVIAQLDMLKRGAELFNWTIEDRKIDDLLEEARELNHASANQLSSTDSAEWFQQGATDVRRPDGRRPDRRAHGRAMVVTKLADLC
jgi:hypothetical protein